MVATILGLVLPSKTRFVLFPLWLSLRLFEQNCTSFQLPQFDQLFLTNCVFTVIYTFYFIYFKSSSNHFRSVSWEILTEDAGGKQIVLEPLQNKQGTVAWSSEVLCKSHRTGNSPLTAHSSSSSLKARTGSSLLLFCFLGAFKQIQCSFWIQPSIVISAVNYFSFPDPNCIYFDCRELDKLSTGQTGQWCWGTLGGCSSQYHNSEVPMQLPVSERGDAAVTGA